MVYFMGWGRFQKLLLGPFVKQKKRLFSIVLLILTFDFDLIFGSIFTFWGPNGLFFVTEKG